MMIESKPMSKDKFEVLERFCIVVGFPFLDLTQEFGERSLSVILLRIHGVLFRFIGLEEQAKHRWVGMADLLLDHLGHACLRGNEPFLKVEIAIRNVK